MVFLAVNTEYACLSLYGTLLTTDNNGSDDGDASGTKGKGNLQVLQTLTRRKDKTVPNTFCPICMEFIKENTSKRNGNDA